jgi:spermidine synthase
VTSLIFRERGSLAQWTEVKVLEVDYQGTTPYHEVLIGHTEAYGKCLFLCGSVQSSASDEGLYHTALVQPAMFTHPAPRRVLIAGGGEGATLREVLRHRSVTRAVMVDIDREVVELCKRYLPEWHQGSFEDPRAEVVIADIFEWLPTLEPGSFDVVLLDLEDPLSDGVAQRTFTDGFYRMVDRVLAPGGIVVTQAGELDHQDTRNMRAIRTTLGQVWPHTRPMRVGIPCFGCDWAIFMASHTPIPHRPPDLDARWEALGGQAWPCFDLDGFAAVTWIPPDLRRKLDRPGRILREGEPMVYLDEAGDED